MTIICIGLAIIIDIFLLSIIIWNKKQPTILKKVCHDILGLHVPNNVYYFDGISVHSYCKICNKEIIQDSQGNWFVL